MKQAQLSSFFKNMTLNPDSNVGNQPRPSQAAPQRRPSGVRDHSVYEATKRNRVFQPSWVNTFPWLRYDKENNVMYCDCCREFKHLHPNSNITLIKGDSSFRKPCLVSHAGSLGHRKCMDASNAKQKPEETPMAKIHHKLSKQKHEQFVFLFNTAYQVARRNLSFRDFQPICQLQVSFYLV